MRYWTHAEATNALPHVRARVRRIRELAAAVRRRTSAVGGNGQVSSSNGHHSERPDDSHDSELRDLLEELDRDGIVVRDPERGLIDFPARSPSGREYLLCWLDGEDSIDWWHWPDAGFAGRTPLSEAPD